MRKWEKNNFGPNFGPLGPIVASYHRIRFQGKLMIQTEGNGKKLRL